MALRPDGLGLLPGNHVCGFYSGSAARDELTAAWVTEGARSGQKCVCFIEGSALLREQFETRIPGQLRHVEFCDVDDATLCIDVERAAELIGPRTKAVVVLDYGCHLADHDQERRQLG